MKLRNKLILSCAALAAVATTAVSTTYAWYTSNTKVQANNIAGSSAAAGNDMLLIANGLESNEGTISAISDATKLVFTSEVEVVAEYVGGGLVNNKLMPAAYDATTKYLQAQGSALTPEAASEDTEAAASYLHFVLYLKNAGTHAGTVTMKIDSLTNETAALPVFPVLGTKAQNLGQYIFGSSHTYTEGETYKIDIRRALAMDYTAQKTTSATDLTLAGEATETALDISPAATIAAGTDSFAGGNALNYYNGVVDAPYTGNVPAALSTYVTTSGITGLAIDASAASLTKLDFKVFLNGWSNACFDACQGQDFKFNLKFEFVKTA